MQEIVATGKTVDDAVRSACEQLGLSRDEVNVEVVELPKKKLFGSVPATVKVSRREDVFSLKDILSGGGAKPEREEKSRPAERSGGEARRPERERTSRRVDEQPAPAVKAEAPRADRPAREAAPDGTERPAQDRGEEIPESELGAPAAAALAYYKTMAHGMGADRLSYRAVKTERGVRFEIDGEDASLVIGRRGETMDSMQYLCTLVSGRTEGEYCKISVDVSGYRQKRERTLVSMAQREAARVLKSGYDRVLEPMNPYERRIIHSAVQEIEGVKSESTGVEPHRRVVISLQNGGHRRARGGFDPKRRGDSRPRSDRRDSRRRPPSEPYVPVETRPADESSADMLYKRIEL